MNVMENNLLDRLCPDVPNRVHLNEGISSNPKDYIHWKNKPILVTAFSTFIQFHRIIMCNMSIEWITDKNAKNTFDFSGA